MAKHYYKPLQQINSIITTKIPGIKPNLILQISFKIINDLVDSYGLLLTLLVFNIYPWMTRLDIPSPSITQYTIVMKKTINKIQKYTIL